MFDLYFITLLYAAFYITLWTGRIGILLCMKLVFEPVSLLQHLVAWVANDLSYPTCFDTI